MQTVLRSLGFIVVAVFGMWPASVNSDDIFRIEIGRDYSKYSNNDLKRRVWELERAVDQIQARVFHLETKPVVAPVVAPVDSWACTIRAMGDSWTGTGPNKAIASAKAIEDCKKARGDGFFCKDPKCEQ